MELLDQVKSFLASDKKDAADAVALLRQMGSRQQGLARRCGRRPHAKFLPIINKELERYVRMRSDAPVKKAKAAAPAATKAEKTVSTAPKKDEYVAPKLQKVFSDAEFDALPAVVREFVKENDLLQKTRAKAIHGLEEVKTDAKRKKLAEQIVEMTAQIDNNFAALDYYKKHGELPSTQEEETTAESLAQVKDDLSNARSRRSKAKASLGKAKTDATKKKYETKYAEEDAEVLRLEALAAKLEQDESLQSEPKKK